MDPKENLVLDLRGTLSPLSLLKVSHLFSELAPDQVLEIRGCDATIRSDLAKLLPDATFEVAPEEDPGAGAGSLLVRVRRAK